MRRLSLALVAIAITFAGCTSPVAEVDPASVPDVPADVAVVSRTNASGPANPTADTATVPSAPVIAPMRIPFLPPVELPLVGRIGAGEPNIAVHPDGTLFATSPSGLQLGPNAASGAAYLWRSQDRGATWETLRAPMESPVGVGPFCSCDADVVTSPDGWTYFSDWWDGNYLVEASSDGGDTWSAAPITTREALVLTRVDRQWLIAGEGGFVGLFYAHFAQVGVGAIPLTDLDTGVHAVFSTDHGASWGDPVIVYSRESGHSFQIAHPRILPDGTLVMPFGDTLVGDDGSWRSPATVMLAVSTDKGATWSHLPVAEAPEGFDNLWAVQGAVDESGGIHVAWAARVDDDVMATYVATSQDVGKTWTSALALRATGLNFLPWIATHGRDTVAVGWYGGNATGDALKAQGDWFAYVAESKDGGTTFAVQKVDDEPVKTGTLCPKGAACGEDRELLDYVSLVYEVDGSLHYAFARSVDGVAHTMVATALAGALA